MSKFLKHSVRQYIFIILSATILLCTLFSNSFANENIFIVEEVKTKGLIDKNFKRENHINKALSLSFEMLMSKVLVSSDLTKIKNVKIKEIKNLINSIQVLDEKYNKNQYESSFKIFYNEEKIKQLLINKSISFSQPKKISVVLLPTLFVDGKIKSFQENYFYNEWNKNKEKNKLIKFILPIDDLDDFLKIEKLKDTIEDLNMQEIAHKYDEKNYIFLVQFP